MRFFLKNIQLPEDSNYDANAYMLKFFLKNNRYFDIKTKTNGTLNNLLLLPITFNSQVTLPIVLPRGSLNSRINVMLTCLYIINLFTNQTSFLKKKITLQQVKKKDSGFVLQSWTFRYYSFDKLYFYIITILPFMRVSYDIPRCNEVVDEQGSLTFALDDITYFANKLNDEQLGWQWQFFFSFWWVMRRINCNTKKSFFFLPFIKNMVWRILWSSLSLRCKLGHGSWTNEIRFSKTMFFYNNLFFSKNFWF